MAPEQQPVWRLRGRYEAERGPGARLAACIVEPLVQGANCMQMVDPAFHAALAERCRARGMLLIFDEIFAGLWRLGAPAVWSRLGVAPDIACYAKLLTGGPLFFYNVNTPAMAGSQISWLSLNVRASEATPKVESRKGYGRQWCALWAACCIFGNTGAKVRSCSCNIMPCVFPSAGAWSVISMAVQVALCLWRQRWRASGCLRPS